MGKHVSPEIQRNIVSLKEVNWNFAAIASYLNFHITPQPELCTKKLQNGSLLSEKSERPQKLS